MNDATAPALLTAPARATDLIAGDLVTELDTPDGPWYPVLRVVDGEIVVDGQDYEGGCEGHEATTCGRYNGPIGETVFCDGTCLAPLPVDLDIEPGDRVLVRRTAGVDPASDSASLALDPASVTVAPSGRFGFYAPERSAFEATDARCRPVVQVAQVIARGAGMEFHPTPARYFAETVAALRPGTALSIDYGQGWSLDENDTAAFVAYADGVG